jgi:hypothetical protein
MAAVSRAVVCQDGDNGMTNKTNNCLRHGGDQYVRVEHVHVNDGGQAVIGNVKTAGSGDAAQGPALTPHANDPVASSAAYGAGRPSTAPAE